MKKLAHLNIIIKPVKGGFLSGETVSWVFLKLNLEVHFYQLVLVRIDPTEKGMLF